MDDILTSIEFHHTGIVTAHLEESIAFYKRLGFESSECHVDPIQDVTIALLTKDTSSIELISPNSPNSPASKWIERIQAGAYHVCFQVKSLHEATDFFKKNGFLLLNKQVPAVAFEGKNIVFLWSKVTGLVELIEK